MFAQRRLQPEELVFAFTCWEDDRFLFLFGSAFAPDAAYIVRYADPADTSFPSSHFGTSLKRSHLSLPIRQFFSVAQPEPPVRIVWPLHVSNVL